MPEPKYVVVDDTDPRIKYDEQWSQEIKGLTDLWTGTTPPWNYTLTRPTNTSANFTFKFNGTKVVLWGSFNTIGQPQPSWTYTIDNATMPTTQSPGGTRANHQQLGTSEVTGAGEHTLSFNVTVPPGGVFWFDALWFVPTDQPVLGETVHIPANDPSVSYSSLENFKFNASGPSYYTDIAGSTATLRFTGSSVVVHTIYPPNGTESKGHYSIDGQPPVDFIIPSTLAGGRGAQAEANLYFEELFHIPGLPPTAHTLDITYDGRQGNTPLVLNSFYVTLPPRGTRVTGGAASISQSQSTSTPSPTQSPCGKSTHVGAIVGGVLGGVAGLAVLVLLGVIIRRRLQRTAHRTDYKTKEVSQLPSSHPNRASYQPWEFGADSQSTKRASYGPKTLSFMGEGSRSETPSGSDTALVAQSYQRDYETLNRRDSQGVQHAEDGLHSTNNDTHRPRPVRSRPPSQYTRR